MAKTTAYILGETTFFPESDKRYPVFKKPNENVYVKILGWTNSSVVADRHVGTHQDNVAITTEQLKGLGMEKKYIDEILNVAKAVGRCVKVKTKEVACSSASLTQEVEDYLKIIDKYDAQIREMQTDYQFVPVGKIELKIVPPDPPRNWKFVDPEAEARRKKFIRWIRQLLSKINAIMLTRIVDYEFPDATMNKFSAYVGRYLGKERKA